MENKCRICAKQWLCNKKECKQIKFSETKNLGEVKYNGDKSRRVCEN